MVARPDLTAWRPAVAGVAEVLHAHFTDHVYPMHAHDTWTLLIVDDGMVRYDLDRHEHGALSDLVTLLPPHVPHNGCPVTPHGFRKRVLYLDADVLGVEHIGRAVDGPALADPLLRRRIHQLHTVLAEPGEDLEAESRLALICERILGHLGHPSRLVPPSPPRPDRVGLAHRLRDLLDEHVPEGLSLQEAATLLHAHPAHLVRAFSREFGIAPHQYLTACRVDRARRLLLEGRAAPEVAASTGFCDQSHLARNFKRIVGVGPGWYARTVRGAGSGPPGMRT
ncbi:helix-turn-helix domain-containing protein [Streptomyces morookaense]|uniref:AraC family transcriptional regulator n=1 Tax=Streptomyces morookaense TaxID=1970 RepID=A0A7Y7B7G2_STRMO|nr:AraC family transcriptional regulator [Streptomyces morookaense]NVK80406.1 AraC family transcriptional regulator [Streptomyces morookaense]GHF14244.1 AraC family transcriptional regulator [Streptomyces morookaense]